MSRVLLHPHYDPVTQDNDVALLELATPLLLNEHAQPVWLPGSGQEVPPTQGCTVSEWEERTGHYVGLRLGNTLNDITGEGCAWWQHMREAGKGFTCCGELCYVLRLVLKDYWRVET